ncbi:MAG: GNAT family N-acetyltransferase [Acidiferrobacterales bacterium]|nr:GNAT family N-acetyltransferase [Acidiferrobacterales bacterium]
MKLEITKADLSNHEAVARLFDLYRQFYKCPPDLKLATQFIRKRIERNESTIFLAKNEGKECGFVQLYPSFCSVDAVKIFILYDLYVDAPFRRSGVARKLMTYTTSWARAQEAARLDLLTAKTNVKAQTLYEELEYKRVLEDFFAYSLNLSEGE